MAPVSASPGTIADTPPVVEIDDDDAPIVLSAPPPPPPGQRTFNPDPAPEPSPDPGAWSVDELLAGFDDAPTEADPIDREDATIESSVDDLLEGFDDSPEPVEEPSSDPGAWSVDDLLDGFDDSPTAQGSVPFTPPWDITSDAGDVAAPGVATADERAAQRAASKAPGPAAVKPRPPVVTNDQEYEPRYRRPLAIAVAVVLALGVVMVLRSRSTSTETAAPGERNGLIAEISPNGGGDASSSSETTVASSGTTSTSGATVSTVDGSVTTVSPDGTVTTVSPDGTVVTDRPDGTHVVTTGPPPSQSPSAPGVAPTSPNVTPGGYPTGPPPSSSGSGPTPPAGGPPATAPPPTPGPTPPPPPKPTVSISASASGTRVNVSANVTPGDAQCEMFVNGNSRSSGSCQGLAFDDHSYYRAYTVMVRASSAGGTADSNTVSVSTGAPPSKVVTVGYGKFKGFPNGVNAWAVTVGTDPYGTQVGDVRVGEKATILCQRAGGSYHGSVVYDYIVTAHGARGWVTDGFTADTPYAQFDPSLTQSCPPFV